MAGPVITVLIDLPPAQSFHVATLDAIHHADHWLNAGVETKVVRTAEIDEALIADPGGGVVVGPGSPYSNPDAVHEVIRSAREQGIPLVGT